MRALRQCASSSSLPASGPNVRLRYDQLTFSLVFRPSLIDAGQTASNTFAPDQFVGSDMK